MGFGAGLGDGSVSGVSTGAGKGSMVGGDSSWGISCAGTGSSGKGKGGDSGIGGDGGVIKVPIKIGAGALTAGCNGMGSLFRRE